MYTPLRAKYVKELEDMSVDFDCKVPGWSEGYMYRAAFANGYGISIVKHDGSHGHGCNTWEIAVLKRGEKNDIKEYDLCYDTPVADDVIGWLTGPEVMEYARKINDLPCVDDEYMRPLGNGLYECEGYIVSEPWDV